METPSHAWRGAAKAGRGRKTKKERKRGQAGSQVMGSSQALLWRHIGLPTGPWVRFVMAL